MQSINVQISADSLNEYFAFLRGLLAGEGEPEGVQSAVNTAPAQQSAQTAANPPMQQRTRGRPKKITLLEPEASEPEAEPVVDLEDGDQTEDDLMMSPDGGGPAPKANGSIDDLMGSEPVSQDKAAKDKSKALLVLRDAYGLPGGAAAVKVLQKKYNVAKFGEVTPDKGTELLQAAQALINKLRTAGQSSKKAAA